MDSLKITAVINKTTRRLKLLSLAKTLQIAVAFGLASALLVTAVSRLSVFPYYGFYSNAAAAVSIVLLLVMGAVKMPRRKQAIIELDHFTPYNQLLTLSQISADSPLAADLARRTEQDIHLSYQLFKKENRDWFSMKWLLISLGLSAVLMLSGLFTAPAQLAAKDREQQEGIIGNMIEAVEQQQQKSQSPIVKKELEKLQEKLETSETAEQALRELVKEQKELALKQREKEQENTEQAADEAQDLRRASEQLAEQAGESQTALSEMGKPVAFDLQQSIAANEATGNPQESAGEEPENGESGSASSEQPGNVNSGEDASASNEGRTAEDGSGEASSGDGTDSESEAQGNAGSEGSGSAPGIGAGAGEGNRELLSIPSRIGGNAEATVDGGELADGATESVEVGPVDAERGTVQSYRDVVGSYSESYFSSAERMKLPPDLQRIVEQYFSSIDSD